MLTHFNSITRSLIGWYKITTSVQVHHLFNTTCAETVPFLFPHTHTFFAPPAEGGEWMELHLPPCVSGIHTPNSRKLSSPLVYYSTHEILYSLLQIHVGENFKH